MQFKHKDTSRKDKELIRHVMQQREQLTDTLGFDITPIWIIHPRDYYFLEHRLHGSPPSTRNRPELLGFPAAVNSFWQSKPELVITFQDVSAILNK